MVGFPNQLRRQAQRATEAVRYLTERYASDDGPSGAPTTQTARAELSREVSVETRRERAQWPLRSQWQLVVWTRQGLLFLVYFATSACVFEISRFSPRSLQQ